AAHLAVGDDVDAGRLLEGDGLVDAGVLDLLELRRPDLIPLQPLPGGGQARGPQEAPDDLAAGLEGHPPIMLSRPETVGAAPRLNLLPRLNAKGSHLRACLGRGGFFMPVRQKKAEQAELLT